MPSELLAAENLGRLDSTGKPLLNAISIQLSAKQYVVLTGASGSGKTLLLRSLAMLDPIDSGELRWCGRRVASADVPGFRAKCVYLHQRLRLGEETVEEAFRGPFRFQQHADSTFNRSRLLTWLDAIDRNESFFDKSVATLSGGESQIVALLRAMQLDPLVLLLDEPTSALDESTTLAVEDLVQSWALESPHRALVWVSHDAAQADRVGQVRWRMQNG